jgi:hypothetical protein
MNKLFAFLMVYLCIISEITISSAGNNINSVDNGIGLTGSHRGKISLKYMNESDLLDFETVSSHGRGHSEIENMSQSAVAFRIVYLLVIFLPAILTLPLALLSTMFRNLLWFNILCDAIGRSGCAFIKWGQVIHGIQMKLK